MSVLRSARLPAAMLLGAAAAGLAVANSPLGPGMRDVLHLEVGLPGVFTLSVEHWIADGLLALFFFAVAVELQVELTRGQLNSARKALQPAIAAAGGVLLPIGIFLGIAGGGPSAPGWPVPTATDIAFALGVLAVVGRGLPSSVRVFLLALAILDDIVGIVLIAVLFTTGIDAVSLLAALALVVVFGVLSRQLGGPRHVMVSVVLVVLALMTWVLVSRSGVHATIAGVALGLAMSQGPARRTRHALEPWVNALVLPLFAFTAALVVIPAVPLTELSPAFWGVFAGLVVGKPVGIALFGWIAQRTAGAGTARLPLADLLAVGALGGIGFTVSLLLAELAFADQPALRDQATLGVLAGSLTSLVLAVMLVSWRAWHYRKTTPAAQP
ncbi:MULTISPECIES: Na+/H+ antiporter NhaA [Microbacterium]|uniref:Na(+)/H(+) antiporter NhaA n=1 Tax=Microbacterium wangchenii TaxID=2541726 RepID=A0ABX5SX30_9MICO|nr:MULTISPECIES: Na+/H+ antiporter NhaA [Microbacterium]MCK6067727.1 Na+/H+ antiporter NhaA [Microbacterium sp. EYE_512]QBR89360.1 Na+/H+ antiporter NhaA [Microbacterium wangchenii]TXK11033.1 Na+/H+ antiporter NhaA [Microbacterium wangchenii]